MFDPAKGVQKAEQTSPILPKICGANRRLRLKFLAGLLHVDYENGQWDEVTDGWRNQRTGHFLTFSEMESRIDARIAELGLDMNRITEWEAAGHSLTERQDFWALNFDQQMSRFRKGDKSK